MTRAQCIVVRGNRVLLVKHSGHGEEFWFPPGGAVEVGESPEVAALRELQEECNVVGRVVRRLSHNDYGERFQECSYLVDIGNQEPSLGIDPEADVQKLTDLKWLTLKEIPERERCYLWAAGLMGVQTFQEEILSWTTDISYPRVK